MTIAILLLIMNLPVSELGNLISFISILMSLVEIFIKKKFISVVLSERLRKKPFLVLIRIKQKL